MQNETLTTYEVREILGSYGLKNDRSAIQYCKTTKKLLPIRIAGNTALWGSDRVAEYIRKNIPEYSEKHFYNLVSEVIAGSNRREL